MGKNKLFAKISRAAGFVVVSLLITTCLACGQLNYRPSAPYFSTLNNVRKSFVKITTVYDLSKILNPKEKASVTGLCSGTIVKVTLDGSHVLTAAHCVSYTNSPDEIKVEGISVSVTDFYFVKHTAIIQKLDLEADMALLYVPNFKSLPAIGLAANPPLEGSMIFNVGCPAGFYPAPGVVIIQQGYFSGDIVYRNRDVSIYSLMAFPGQSGSMILDDSGRMIGMLHSAHSRANVITLSPTYKVLKMFLA